MRILFSLARLALCVLACLSAVVLTDAAGAVHWALGLVPFVCGVGVLVFVGGGGGRVG